MSKIIAISNQKGGVGKTTTAMNLAAGLAKKGRKVLCIDFDPQGNLSDYLGYEGDDLPTISELMQDVISNRMIRPLECIRKSEQNCLDYIPANIALTDAEIYLNSVISRETVLRRILKNDDLSYYDYIVVDCLPHLGLLMFNVLTAADSVIVPVQTQKFSLDGLQRFFETFEQIRATVNPSLKFEGILLNMVKNTIMSKTAEAVLKEEYKDILFTAKIHDSTEAPKSTCEQKSLVLSKGSRLGKDFDNLVGELLEREV